jgi:hypothetical protein
MHIKSKRLLPSSSSSSSSSSDNYKMASSPPKPKETALRGSWYLFGLLENGAKCSPQDFLRVQELLQKHTTKKVMKKTTLALARHELEAYHFESPHDACFAFIRAQALLDTVGPSGQQDNVVWASKALLLMGRSALWLARDTHKRHLDLPLREGIREGVYKDIPVGLGFAEVIRGYLKKAIEDPVAKPLCLTLLARVLVGAVASDKGRYARPAMAEAWLCAAETEVLLAEISAALAASKASGKRPPGRLVPCDGDSTPEEEEFLRRETERYGGWAVGIPGLKLPEGQDECQVQLADYWWGQSEVTAASIAGDLLISAIRFIARYESLVDDETAKRLWKRTCGFEQDLSRRGAVALASLDAATDQTNPEKRQLVEHLRLFFPGTPFEPTEDFVRSLKKSPSANNGSPGDDYWTM